MSIDYTTTEGVKLYYNATKGLEPKYDLKPEGMKTFLELVQERAETYGFNNVLLVPTEASLATYITAYDAHKRVLAIAVAAGAVARPVFAPPAMTTRNLVNMYGSITMSECRAHATHYYDEMERKAQNAAMLYRFLLNSITMDGVTELTTNASQYRVSGVSDGVCFLKHMIAKVHVDTKSTVNTLRGMITQLPDKMVELGGDIRKFNTYVKGIMLAMVSYNATYPEVEYNLFRAYRKVEDEIFHNYLM
jgi:hypothetical protein